MIKILLDSFKNFIIIFYMSHKYLKEIKLIINCTVNQKQKFT